MIQILKYKKTRDLLIAYAFIGVLLINTNEIDKVNTKSDSFNPNINIEDEINPLCNGDFFEQNLNFNDIKSLQIDINDSNGWYRNLISAYFSEEIIMKREFKNYFLGKVKINILDKECSYDAEVRINGDFKDHIEIENLNASLDVKLLNGNILGIVKFKLFIPETRYSDNEIFVTSVLEELNFTVPRTSYINVNINNFGEKIYIFQEKVVKELLEFHSFREGPILEANEKYYWENRDVENFNRPMVFAKLLNFNWLVKNKAYQNIVSDSFTLFNKSLFTTKSFADINYHALGENNLETISYDAALIALDARHGTIQHNRKFYYNYLNNKFIPIYYDGSSQILTREFVKYPSEDVITNNLDDLKIGAKYLLSLPKIKSKDLILSIRNKGAYLSEDEIVANLNKFYKYLNNIVEYSYFNDNTQEITTTLNNFQEFNFYQYNIDKEKIEVCGNNISSCKVNNSDGLDNKIFNLDDNNIFLGNKDFNLIDNRKLIMSLENIKIYAIGNPIIQVNEKTQNISIQIENTNENILFVGPGKLKNWKFDIHSTKIGKEITSNEFTGCLSFYDVEFDKVSISSTNLSCEDSVNIISSKGQIEEIKIIDSISDGLDIDFSSIIINNIEIINSLNDCLDLSGGEYFINNFKAVNCGDKGLSIGESSNVTSKFVNIDEAKFGIAVKDSSNLYLDQFNGNNIETCFASYRKKQEFSSSSSTILVFKCNGILNNYIQKGSKLTINE